MFKGRFNKFVALFMSLVFSFNLFATEIFSMRGYAAENPVQIAHDQNLSEANAEGLEESQSQKEGNGSQLPFTILLRKQTL